MYYKDYFSYADMFFFKEDYKPDHIQAECTLSTDNYHSQGLIELLPLEKKILLKFENDIDIEGKILIIQDMLTWFYVDKKELWILDYQVDTYNYHYGDIQDSEFVDSIKAIDILESWLNLKDGYYDFDKPYKHNSKDYGLFCIYKNLRYINCMLDSPECISELESNGTVSIEHMYNYIMDDENDKLAYDVIRDYVYIKYGIKEMIIDKRYDGTYFVFNKNDSNSIIEK